MLCAIGHFCECLSAGDPNAAVRIPNGMKPRTGGLAINPNYVTAEIGLGLAWAQTGEISKAIEFYNEALAKNPSIVGTRARPVSSLHNNYGMLLLRVGLAPVAADHFRKAVEIFPLSVNGHLNLANMAFAEERYADAIAEYEIARSLSPGNLAIEQQLERARQSARQTLPDDNAASP
jgi:tetratricopeptide (TPR) repeat protein